MQVLSNIYNFFRSNSMTKNCLLKGHDLEITSFKVYVDSLPFDKIPIQNTSLSQRIYLKYCHDLGVV
jgi:hypothetical protein